MEMATNDLDCLDFSMVDDTPRTPVADDERPTVRRIHVLPWHSEEQYLAIYGGDTSRPKIATLRVARHICSTRNVSAELYVLPIDIPKYPEDAVTRLEWRVSYTGEVERAS